jgi:hypothetical protein
MPSDRKQFNVRADPETEDRIRRLLPLIRGALGLEVTVSDLFRMGMVELERKYGGGEAAPASGRRPRGKKG